MPAPRRAKPSDESLSKCVAYIAMAEGEAIASMEEQERLIEEDVKAHDARVLFSARETLQRAWTPPMLRTGLRQALRALRVHDAGVFIVAHRTRLGMEPLEQILVTKIIEDLGAHVVAVSGGLSGSRSERALQVEARQTLWWYRTWIEEQQQEEAHACLRRVQGWPQEGPIAGTDGVEKETE